ncbi:hypothetical protein CsSME_00040093 [Camellia sinensis var. sinensis]
MAVTAFTWKEAIEDPMVEEMKALSKSDGSIERYKASLFHNEPLGFSCQSTTGNDKDKIIVCMVYVDGTVVTNNGVEAVTQLKVRFVKDFESNDLCPLRENLFTCCWKKQVMVVSLCGFQALLEDLGIYCGEPSKMCCNKKAAINIVYNLVKHDRTKHIEICEHLCYMGSLV